MKKNCTSPAAARTAEPKNKQSHDVLHCDLWIVEDEVEKRQRDRHVEDKDEQLDRAGLGVLSVEDTRQRDRQETQEEEIFYRKVDAA